MGYRFARGYKRGEQIFWVRASEFQRQGVLHYHALISSPVDLNEIALRLYWKEEWLRISGGFSRVLKVEKSAACIRYITKYVVKGGEIELSKSLLYFRRQDSLLAS